MLFSNISFIWSNLSWTEMICLFSGTILLVISLLTLIVHHCRKRIIRMRIKKIRQRKAVVKKRSTVRFFQWHQQEEATN